MKREPGTRHDIIETAVIVAVVLVLGIAIGRYATTVKFAGRQQLLYELVLDEQRETSGVVQQVITIINNQQSAIKQLSLHQQALTTKLDVLTSMVVVGRRGE
jgi:hypothetical protein